MHRILTIAFLIATTALIPAAAQDNPEMEAAITRYFEITKAKENTLRSFEKMASSLPKESQAMFRHLIAKVVTIDEILDITRNLIRKHYTVEEINALSDFYSTPVGESAINKLQLIMEESIPYIHALIKKSIEEVRRAQDENPALFESIQEDAEASEPSKD